MDYMTLKVIWWGIIGFLMIAFALTGGMDIGVNFLLPIIGKDDNERRLILNSIGPTWEGNQVWLVTLGAGLFAIWPTAYGTIFSSMYLAFMLVLLMLILRPPGIDYRGKINSQAWRRMWDIALISGAIILALSFGVVIGNLFTGLPFYFDSEMRLVYEGTFISLFSPCALICGVACLCMLGLQGAFFLQYKLPEQLTTRVQNAARLLGFSAIVSLLMAGLYITLRETGYQIVKIGDLNTGLKITNKTVQAIPGWAFNFVEYKMLWLLPIAALLSIFIAIKLSQKNNPVAALFTNSISIILILLSAGFALFPFVIPSSSNANHSLTIWDVSSSSLTLHWALLATLILVPIILLYTSWVYKVMRGTVKIQPESY